MKRRSRAHHGWLRGLVLFSMLLGGLLSNLTVQPGTPRTAQAQLPFGPQTYHDIHDDSDGRDDLYDDLASPIVSFQAVPATAPLNGTGDLPPGAAGASVVPQALGDVVNSFPAPDNGFLDLEWIDGFLWVASSSGSLYRLAPGDGTVLETISLPDGVTSCGLAWDGSSFWIADCDANQIVQVSTSGTVMHSFPAPAMGPVGLAWDGAYLWDVSWQAAELHRIDPATGVVVRTIPAPDTRAAGLAWDGRYLWTNGRDSALTYKLRVSDGGVVTSFGTPPGPGEDNGRGGAFDGRYLWIANLDALMIYQIDVEHVFTAYLPVLVGGNP